MVNDRCVLIFLLLDIDYIFYVCLYVPALSDVVDLNFKFKLWLEEEC